MSAGWCCLPWASRAARRVGAGLIGLSLLAVACGAGGAPAGRIAFARAAADGTLSVWVMDGDGGNLSQLIEGVALVEFPGRGPGPLTVGFSRGGRILVFRAHGADGPHLYCADIDQKRLTDLGPETGAFEVALDGSKILLHLPQTNGRWGLALLPACDGQPREILVSEAEYVSGEFSPDGRHVLVTSAAAGTTQLRLVETRSGAEVELLAMDGFRAFGAGFTADGRDVLVRTGDEDGAWRLVSIPDGRERVLGFDGSVIGLATLNGDRHWLAAFGPSGLTLAWSGPDGATSRPLVSGAEQYVLAAAPNAEHALAVAYRGGLADFFVLGANEQDFREVVVDAAAGLSWGFSPSGRYAALAATVAGSPRQMVIDLADEQQWSWPAGGQPAGFAFSPDSRWLAYSAPLKGRPALYVVDLEAGTPRLLLDNAWQPVWSR